MVDKAKESNIQSMAELQQELKSLKALLLSRGPPTAASSSALNTMTRPSIPSWQLASTSGSGFSDISDGAGDQAVESSQKGNTHS